MRVQFHSFGHAKKKKGVWQLNAEGALDVDPLNIKVLLQSCRTNDNNRNNSNNDDDNDYDNDDNNSNNQTLSSS